jgi:peptidase C25-like protein
VNTRFRIARYAWKWLLRIGLVMLTALWILLTPDMLWPVISKLHSSPSNMKTLEPEGVNYLVIAPQALAESASAWANYRRSEGYQTQAVLLTPSQAKAESIRDLIQKTYTQNKEPNPFYVLLIGHAHPDSSHPDTYLPSGHFVVSPDQSSGYGTDPIASDDALVVNFSS